MSTLRNVCTFMPKERFKIWPLNVVKNAAFRNRNVSVVG